MVESGRKLPPSVAKVEAGRRMRSSPRRSVGGSSSSIGQVITLRSGDGGAAWGIPDIRTTPEAAWMSTAA